MSHPAVPAIMAITSVASAIMQGQAQSAQLDAEEAALEHEKKQLLQQRIYLDEARDEELDLFRRETKELLGLQTVGFAKTGVELSGSVINVLNQTELDAKEEEDRIYQQYARARTMNDLRRESMNSQLSNIDHQRSLIFPMAAAGALSGAATSWYTGRKLTKKKTLVPKGRVN